MSMIVENINPMHYADLFGVDPKLVAAAKMKGLFLKVSGKDTIGIYDSKEELLGSAVVKTSAITLATLNNIGPASKKAVAKVLSDLIDGASAKENFSEVYKGPVPNKFYVNASISEFEKGIKSAMASKLKPDIGNLIDVLSPIKGVSPGSTYRVVAIFLSGAVIAIKRSTDVLSIRVQGGNMDSYAEALKEIGFFKKDTYCSVHFQVPSTDLGMAERAVGAVSSCIGLGLLKKAVSVNGVKVEI